MAERRMFSKTIIDSDAFLDMPLSTQALYFHLSMRADDDGFVNNPKKIQRIIGCGDDDLKLLMVKKFLIPFESGIVVIKHWKIHNYIAKDRYHETNYLEEKSMLGLEKNKSYSLVTESDTCKPLNRVSTSCIHTVNKMDTQVRLDKNSIDKNREDKKSIEGGQMSAKCPPEIEIEIEKEVKKIYSCGDSDFNIFKYAEMRNFILSPIQIQQLQDDINTFSIEEVKKALDIADNNGKHTYSYVKGILQRRRTEGDKQKKSNSEWEEMKKAAEKGEDPF